MKISIKGLKDFFKAYIKFRNLGDAIWVFGSARTKPSSMAYKQAQWFGRRAAERGITIMTGGGPGIMEAAAKGAIEAGGKTIGLAINLPMEQRIPPFQTKHVEFKYFFTRKVVGVRKSQAFVAFEGGFGTLDEIFEVITLMQCGKTPKRPVILIGVEYWRGLIDWIYHKMCFHGNITYKEAAELLILTDNVEKALDIIEGKAK